MLSGVEVALLAIIALLIVISKFRRSKAFRLEARGPQVVNCSTTGALYLKFKNSIDAGQKFIAFTTSQILQHLFRTHQVVSAAIFLYSFNANNAST